MFENKYKLKKLPDYKKGKEIKLQEEKIYAK